MGLSKYINIPIFLSSLAVGLFFVYIFEEDKRKIYVFPKPDNYESIQYKDRTGTCFSIKQEKTQCPKDASSIFSIPAQN
jgi:hypothetical protein